MRKLSALVTLGIICAPGWAQECDMELFESPGIFDTYHEYYDQPEMWNGFNVHDPTVYKEGEWYYMYNTDVGMGYNAGTGALKRRSQDLVHWEFLGQAFEGLPDSARNFFLHYNPSYTDNGIWAPFLMQYKDEFRLYYSAPGGLDGENLAFIGWATSSSAGGPWIEQGGIASSIPGDTINAIDPTVVIDRETGQHWMAYGSYENGIYIVELDSTTGGLKTPGDRGVRIAARTGGRHAAIEGAEISYRNGWYYLFVSYDWLENYYNVRVGRSENPYGPYYDIKGVDMAEYSNNYPVILKAYRFNDHEGWQGTGHCSVYNDSGQYFLFSQARPSTDIYNMVLHTRKMFWIDDWPVLSPERYAGVPQCTIPADSLYGSWEFIELKYIAGILHSPSTSIELREDGTLDGIASDTWALQDSLLTLSWDEGATLYKTQVFRGWDWENSCPTLLFTGMDEEGENVWGKKINQKAVDRYTKLESGAAYTIRSHYSNMLIEVPGGNDDPGTSIRQGKDNGEAYQIWRIARYDDGNWKLVALHSVDNKVIEVPDGDPNATFLNLGEFTGEDKQKFALEYKGDGYFKILSYVSDFEKCFDLYNFSIEEGGFISQWTDLGGVNQAWRFKRIDSLGIDNRVALGSTVRKSLNIYPNPFVQTIFIDLPQGVRLNQVQLINSLGQIVYQSEMNPSERQSLTIPETIRGKIFVLRIVTNEGIWSEKILRK